MDTVIMDAVFVITCGRVSCVIRNSVTAGVNSMVNVTMVHAPVNLDGMVNTAH